MSIVIFKIIIIIIIIIIIVIFIFICGETIEMIDFQLSDFFKSFFQQGL